jgi:hypothetical protein
VSHASLLTTVDEVIARRNQRQVLTRHGLDGGRLGPTPRMSPLGQSRLKSDVCDTSALLLTSTE